MKHFCLLAALLLCMIQNLYAQDPLEDNSYLIEEAFNQEPHVVQHISNLVYSRPGKDWNYSLTQEWPVMSVKHQLSYSIPYAWLSNNNVRGFGDIFINYRFQASYKESWASFSPRLSVIIPAGDDKKNLGSGKIGYQVNLPVSKQLSEQWIAHVNAGTTLTPGVKMGTGKKNLIDYNVGGSVIWLMKWNVNFMLEYLSVWEDDGNKRAATHTFNPGFRYGYDMESLQIVPGVSVPLQLNGKNKSKGIFLYLSLEHPF